VEQLAKIPTSRPSYWMVRGISMFTVIGLFYCYKIDRLLHFITAYWMRTLALIYSRREKALFDGRNALARVISGGMLAFMAPFAILGFFRAVYLRRDIVRLARGEHIIT